MTSLECPACKKRMYPEVQEGNWELEIGEHGIGTPAPSCVIARLIHYFKCPNCKTRIQYVSVVAKYNLDKNSVKTF